MYSKIFTIKIFTITIFTTVSQPRALALFERQRRSAKSLRGTQTVKYFCTSNKCEPSSKSDLSKTNQSIRYCTKEDIPNDVDFRLIETKYEIFELSAGLEISFAPPRRTCKYSVTLLANESINETMCTTYNFKNSLHSNVHTPTTTLCFISNKNESQSNTSMTFPYVFTACYAIQFRYDQNKCFRVNQFLKARYKRTEITLPELKCSYLTVHNTTKGTKYHFEVDISLPIIFNATLEFGSFYYYNGNKYCITKNKQLNYTFNVLDYAKNEYDSSMSLFRNGKYEKTEKFEIEVSEQSNYCFKIRLNDVRCEEYTLWNPFIDKYKPCQWVKECHYISNEVGISEPYVTTNSYLYWSIGIITLIMFAVLGILYLLYTVHTCIQEKRFCVNVGKSNIIKINQKQSNRFNICALKNIKQTSCESIHATNTDIVLLYPKSSESFMALMKDFREMLQRLCHCHVHDWYDGTEWNYVAEIGGSDWFAEMLDKGYRVIWIDIPAMRSLITRTPKTDFIVKDSKQYDSIEIGDFRDTVFLTIFNLAKRNVEHSPLGQRKHFIVRLKGFERFKNEDDPFVDLSMHTRYLIPQDLNSLCSDLST
ncbi:uncharacterized protein LOC122403712 [Colletes gigas]|uniref:uncharacterized protein LOC122403712 n=1 Tax=Colletes gigas TaxID=935657 RepID=UPI001C9A715D|nr:uncharacterized protein LOC122403712 [Colletes gigas]